MINALVLRVAGINCHTETAFALKKAGFKTSILHLNEILNSESKLKEFSIIIIPGGFSFGDHLGSAKVLANQLKFNLKEDLKDFIKEEKLVLGICNGFQALIKAGILPGFIEPFEEQKITLSFNESMHFQDEWIEMEKFSDKTPFLEGIESLKCPINHGEGKFIPKGQEILKQLYENNQVVLKYLNNPNGSVDNIAGICNNTGRVFGLMPHPEKHLFSMNSPYSTRTNGIGFGDGYKIFKNAFNYFKK